MSYLYEKGGVKIRDSVISDVHFMKDRLRKSDLSEIEASHGQTGEVALSYGFENSKFCGTVLYHHRPCCMFGVVPDMSLERVGTVWLLATDELKKMWITFIKLSPTFIRSMLEARPVLYNYIDNRNIESIRWLTWCGAQLKGPKPYGVNGLPFYFFVFEKSKVKVA